MKKIAIGLVGLLALTACGGNNDSGTTKTISTYSGNYSVNMSYQGRNIANYDATINQTNSPNDGDFTGGLRSAATLTSSIVGNINSGKMTVTDPPSAYGAGAIDCAGSWSNGNHYVGNCNLTSPYGNYSNVAIVFNRK